MANFKTLITTSIVVVSSLFSSAVLANENIGSVVTNVQTTEQKLNINQASFEQLIALKGIGPAKAQAILDYIEQHGHLVSLDELLEIRGIGQRLLAKLKLQLSL